MAVDAGTIFSEVRIEIDKISGDIKRIETKLDQFAKNSQTRSDAVSKNWTDSFKQIGLAGVAAFAAIGIAIKKGITTFAGFEQSLANVQSVARATPEEFEKIEEAARAAGETTKFTASEAADALYSLASAGLDAAEATAALDGVLKLAGATQSDLAFTSATVTAALSQFGLEADQSIEVANTFAAAIGNSQANMQKLATSLRQVGPVTGALGISLEKTVGALQALFDAGFQGEQAGTALRNILSSLANEVDPTVRKLEELGLKFEDLNPEVNDIADIIGTLSEANLEAGQIISAFGREAGPQLLSLLKVGKAGLEEYTEAVTDTQAAAEAYEIQMNTLQGDLAELRSATESVAISFVKEFAPAIRVAIDFLTKLIRGLNALPSALKIFFGVLAVGIPIITGLGVAIATLGTIISATILPILAVVGAIAALTAGGVALNRAYNRTAYAADDLNKAHKNLETNTNALKESIEKYKKANDELKKSNEELSDSEVTLLEGRRKLAGLEVAANLQRTVKALTELKKKSDENSIAAETYTKRIQTLQKDLKNNNAEVERLAELQRDGVKWFSDYSGGATRVGTSLRYANTALKNNVQYIQDATTALEKSRLAEESANVERQETIDYLASSLNLGIIQLSQIELYNKGIASQVALRAAQIKEEEKLAEKRKELAEADTSEVSNRVTEEQQKRIDSNDKLTESIKKSREELEELGKSEIEILNIQRDRRNEEIAASKSSAKLIKEAIDANNEYVDAKIALIQREERELEIKEKLKNKIAEGKKAREEATAATEQAEKQTADYELELLKLIGTEEEVIEAERQRAIASVMASGASEEAIEKQVEAINRLYDELVSSTATGLEMWIEENKKYIDEAFGLFSDFFSALDAKTKSSADKQIAEINRVLEAELIAIDQRLQQELESKGLTEESKIESLERELSAAIEKGDAELSSQLKNEIEKTKILEKYEAERTAAEEAAARKSAELEYKAALSSWKIQVAQAIAGAAAAIVNIWARWAGDPVVAGLLTAGAIGVTGVQISAINDAKPEPPSFQTGGIVIPSGSRGREIIAAENGSPELLLNAGQQGESFLNDFARRIGAIIAPQLKGGGVINLLLDIDGRRVAESSAQYYNNGQVRIQL